MERCKVQVNLELGHRAQLSEKEMSEDLTHDWIVFVRGPETGDIHHLVEKVVFHLPKSFPKPKRVCKEPPYQVVESGSAGFLMHIEVYFKNKEQPKKVCFKYDLFLNPEGEPPADRLRCEKLTFNNPTKEFRRKLTKAGGVTVVPEGAEAASRSSPDSPMPPKKKTRTELQQYNPYSARQTRGGGSSEAVAAAKPCEPTKGPESTALKRLRAKLPRKGTAEIEAAGHSLHVNVQQ